MTVRDLKLKTQNFLHKSLSESHGGALVCGPSDCTSTKATTGKAVGGSIIRGLMEMMAD